MTTADEPKVCARCAHQGSEIVVLPFSADMVSTCDRVATRHIDVVTGDEIISGYRPACWDERSSWGLMFWRPRCGPSGRFFQPKPKILDENGHEVLP